LGIGPFVLNLEEKLSLSEWLYEELKKISQIEVICPPELSILTFAHKKGDEATKALLTKINTKETLFLSACSLEGKWVIRICLLGFRMHYERLQKALSEIQVMANEC
jgi:aromatic-L-amino-acid decarboxylase